MKDLVTCFRSDSATAVLDIPIWSRRSDCFSRVNALQLQPFVNPLTPDLDCGGIIIPIVFYNSSSYRSIVTSTRHSQLFQSWSRTCVFRNSGFPLSDGLNLLLTLSHSLNPVRKQMLHQLLANDNIGRYSPYFPSFSCRHSFHRHHPFLACSYLQYSI